MKVCSKNTDNVFLKLFQQLKISRLFHKMLILSFQKSIILLAILVSVCFIKESKAYYIPNAANNFEISEDAFAVDFKILRLTNNKISTNNSIPINTSKNTFFSTLFEKYKSFLLLQSAITFNNFLLNTGTGTVVSSSGVPDASNANGTPDGSYASLYETNDEIILDLGEILSANTDVDIIWLRPSNSTAEIAVSSSSVAASGFTAVGGSPFTVTTQNVVLTQTVTVPAGDRYLSILSNNGFDLGVDAISFTCPSGGGGSPGNLTCTAGATEISGLVFEDYDFDGLLDGTETQRIENITVTATDSLGNSMTAITDVSGAYTISGLVANRTYRVEFTNFPSWAEPTFKNGDNGTTVQFLTPENCANIGLAQPSDFCDSNPPVVLACYENGDGTNNNNVAALKYNYNDSGIPMQYSGSAANPNTLSTIAQIGTVWGTAYDRINERVYTSAFLKRHVGLGPLGLGGMYIINPNSGYLGSFDLQGVTPANGGSAIDFGSINRTTVPNGISNGAAGDNQLSEDPNEATIDLDAFAKVGTTGMGDTDIEEAANKLWTINLNTSEAALISIDLDDAANPIPTNGTQVAGAIVNRYLLSGMGIPDCSTANGVFRPWGLGFNKGKGYVCGVCSAENGGTRADLSAYVLSFDPSNPATGFTQELTFALDFTREQKSDFGGHDEDGDWQPWADVWSDISFNGRYSDNATPIFSDIEFRENGDLILGFIDRYSHQLGYQMYEAVSASQGNGLYDNEQAGDIYHVCLVNGAYVTEGLANCADNDIGTSIGSSLTNDGINGLGEYYWEDVWRPGGNQGHGEISTGALAILKGTGEVISTAFDPVEVNGFGDANTHGTVKFNTADGSKSGEYMIINFNGTDLGKAGALSDLILACSPAPIEIGNFVWIDTDKDGVQDPGEPAAVGVTMELYDASGNLLATDVTDANGQYYFSNDASDDATWVTANDGLNYNTFYYIVAGGNGQYSGGIINLNGTDYELTTTDNASGGNADFIDNDGAIASGVDPDFDGEPYVQILTGDAGNVRHLFDFGLRETCPNPSASVFAIQPSCTNGVAQSDGYLQISEVTNGDRYHFSVGSSFNDNVGANTYANATDLTSATYPLQFNTGLSNSDIGDFTIRIYNGENTCFTDVVVTLNSQDCMIGCDCTEMIYLNETSNGGRVHKFTVAANGDLTEIQNAGGPWYPGAGTSEIGNPHGIAIDLNGNIYISTDPFSGDIRQLNCDGEITSAADFLLPEGGFNFGSIGNKLYINRSSPNSNREIVEYDLCTQLETRTACMNASNTSFPDWGFYIDPRTEEMFATSAYLGSNVGDNEVFKFTQSNFAASSPTCVDPFIPGGDGVVNVGDNELPHGYLRGVTTDPTGNIYIVMLNDGDGSNGTIRDGKLVKYDANGGFLLETPFDSTNDNVDGLFHALGIVYSSTTNTLFISKGEPTANCVQEFDLNLNDLGVAVGPVPSGDVAKGIGLIKECCPTNNNITIDTTLCTASVNDLVFLQELINCEGNICEGVWQEGGSNTGLNYNSCDNTVTITALDACGSFTLESDGTGNNPQCGAFKITVNISVTEVTSSVIAADQTICAGGDPAAFTVTTPATGGTLSYQWQSSTTDCSTGFMDISGAMTDTYDPPAGLTETTYYRVIVNSANAGCSTGMCADTSNCITVTANFCPYSLGNQVFADTDNSGDLNGGEMGIDGVQLQLLNGADGSVYDSDPNMAGIQALTVTTANGGYYRFDDLPAGDYIVEVLSSNFGASSPLENLLSSTGANQEADPDSDGDINDNGLDTPVSGATRSGVVTLGTPEPTGEVEPASYGAGSTTPNSATAAADDFSNLTVDFGFYSPCNIMITQNLQNNCTDPSTPNDDSDDYFTITFNATNSAAGASNQYEVLLDATVLGTATYGTAITVGNGINGATGTFVADGTTTYTLTIRDMDDSTCSTTYTTTIVVSCSACPPTICLPVQITRHTGSN